MRPNYVFFMLAMIVMIESSCYRKVVVVKTPPAPAKKLPPGQAKKITGSRSAKAYAPGQQKKP